MKLKSEIPTEVLDNLFDLEPNTDIEPMSNDWFELHEQTKRDEEAKKYWSTEKAYLAQQEFLLKRQVSKTRSRLKHTKWRGNTE
jgi:hypothetical protein